MIRTFAGISLSREVFCFKHDAADGKRSVRIIEFRSRSCAMYFLRIRAQVSRPGSLSAALRPQILFPDCMRIVCRNELYALAGMKRKKKKRHN